MLPQVRQAFWIGSWFTLALTFGCARPDGETEKTARREVMVAAAADLQFALEEIVKEFRLGHSDMDIKVSYGSSGNFYSQLLNQAPFDIYLSADLQYPNELQRQGLTLPGSEFTYAVGRIVIWAPSSSGLDVEQLKMEALRDPSVRHLAIANPRHAPYGRAAEAAMRSFGVYEAIQNKLIFGDNVAQALQFVQSGSAEAGIIALALARSPNASGKGRYWEIPPEAYPRMEQGGAILKWAKDPEAAQSLRSYILGPEGRKILERHGFSLPAQQAAEQATE